MKPKRKKTRLSMWEAWDELMRGNTVGAIRMSEGTVAYIRRQAMNLGRTLVDSGIGSYRCYSLV